MEIFSLPDTEAVLLDRTELCVLMCLKCFCMRVFLLPVVFRRLFWVYL